MNNCFIILAAGESKRFKSNTPKPYYLYKGKPIFKHSIDKAKESNKFKKSPKKGVRGIAHISEVPASAASIYPTVSNTFKGSNRPVKKNAKNTISVNIKKHFHVLFKYIFSGNIVINN